MESKGPPGRRYDDNPQIAYLRAICGGGLLIMGCLPGFSRLKPV
jgi:hypothetical protein